MMKKRRVKILRIQSRICIGGPAIHTELLSRYLPKDKYETILLGGALEPGESSKFSQIKEKGVDIRIVHNMRREPDFWNDLRAVREVYKIIRKEKPTIVHTHTAKAGFIGRIAAWLAGVPIIIHTFHGHTFENYFGKIKTQFFILIERFLAKISTRIIAISPEQKKDLSERFRIVADNKISTIRLGFELEKFLSCNKNGKLKSDLSIPKDSFLIASIGRLVPVKNHRMALLVLKKLVERKKMVQLCIVGDGEERENLRRFVVEMGLESFVHFTGWVKEIETIYSGIDLLLLTSLNEGTPVAVIEALASSVPVVATSVGGVPDLIMSEQNGLLCASDDASGMTRQILRLMDDDSLAQRLSRHGRRFAAQTYSYTRLIDETDILYDYLLDDTIIF